MTEETYQEYMLRLENEMDHFRRDMFAKSPSAVYDEAQHIINMTYVYDYDEGAISDPGNQLIRALSLLSVISKCLPNFEHFNEEE
mgnify:CR=1 FL=1